MYDMTEFLSTFFIGPFTDRRSAILGVVEEHGERSMVIGTHDGRWWGQPWHAENYDPARWPDGFELIDRWEAGIARLKSQPVRLSLDTDRISAIRNIFGRTRAEATTDDFDFANWLADDDFDVALPEKPEDVRIAANIAGSDDETFFRILSEHQQPGNRQDRRK